MKADNVKLILGYAIVAFVIVAGFFELDRLASHELAAGTDISFRLGMVGIIAGFIGAGLQFVTGNEIATRAVNAANRSFTAGSTASSTTPTPPPDEGDGA